MSERRRAKDSTPDASIRRLVACPECGLQYDVGGRSAGAQFHCSCGETLTIREPKPHDAAVVRCSSCGAPRDGGATECGYCGASFTLHERDLHTICPECTTRISDRARYCHHCGVLVAPVGSAGFETARSCPACGQASRLVSRSLGGEEITVLECGRCAGLWLGNEVFEHLERRSRQQAASGEGKPVEPARMPPTALGGGESSRHYRPCPLCTSLMHRRNYGRHSGVIVDTCRQHGLWFDQGELAAIVGWI
ncbi:MAG: zinc ribbon domain-containing protein, partial [Thermoanaerobaculia bacterium]|nr:zinc ribbon domain-containing protein [Thermoanaerobaculia bacterium]